MIGGHFKDIIHAHACTVYIHMGVHTNVYMHTYTYTSFIHSWLLWEMPSPTPKLPYVMNFSDLQILPNIRIIKSPIKTEKTVTLCPHLSNLGVICSCLDQRKTSMAAALCGYCESIKLGVLSLGTWPPCFEEVQTEPPAKAPLLVWVNSHINPYTWE